MKVQIKLLDSDGMPIPNSFTAENVSKMQTSLLNNPKSDFVYTLMARALNVHAPPFCLSLFGTDNKFAASQVSKRWTRTENMLEAERINVLGWSSDGEQCSFGVSFRPVLQMFPKIGKIGLTPNINRKQFACRIITIFAIK